jgi:hypothetical protein
MSTDGARRYPGLARRRSRFAGRDLLVIAIAIALNEAGTQSYRLTRIKRQPEHNGAGGEASRYAGSESSSARPPFESLPGVS